MYGTLLGEVAFTFHLKELHLKYGLIQSTLVISKSKGHSRTLRDIHTSTYHICSIEEKTIRTTTFHK